MSNSDNMNDDAAENALRHGLRANPLSPAALERIRAAAQTEWRASTAASRPQRQWIPMAAAASAVLAAAVVWVLMSLGAGADNGAVLGTVARTETGGMVQVRTLRRDVLLKAGSPIRAGQTLDVRGDSLVSLAGGGNLRVARATSLQVLSADTLKLERGELYVDVPPGSRGADAFVVVTAAGEFRHVGTQFAVAIVNGQTRLRVREGSVRWHATEGDSTVGAGTEVVYDSARQADSHPIPTAGRDWAWAEAMAPDIDIENRPLLEFLDWFSRETGRKLVMADEAARLQAATIRMHGTVRGLTTMEALTAVMSSTSLRFELPEGLIRVSSTGASKASLP